MMIAPSNSLYNQNALDDRDFVANFVARHTTLDALIRRLRAAKPGQSDANHVLIGPRGMGRRVIAPRLEAPKLADR